MTKVYIDSYAMDFTKDQPDGYVQYQQLTQHMFKYEAECKQPFESSSRAYMLNDLVFASSLTHVDQSKSTRDANLVVASASDYIIVMFYRNHSVQIETELGTLQVNPDQLIFVDLAKPITIHGQSVDVLSFNIPKRLLNPLVSIKDNLHGSILNQAPHAHLLIGYMKALEHVASEVEVKDTEYLVDCILRMVAYCLNNAVPTLQVTSQPNTEHNQQGSARVSLLQMKHEIDAHILDPRLGLDFLMQQFHVSRTTIYRMFEPLGGVTSYIQNRKLDFAYRELSKHSEKKQNISRLAYQLGFSHPSSFSRAFQSKFGIRPSEVKVKSTNKPQQEIPWHIELDLTPYRR